MLLVGDIGGTNTRLALFELSDSLHQINEHRFLSSNFKSLEDAIKSFIEKFNIEEEIKIASLAIAGPVKNQRCQATNIPWIVDSKSISKKLGIKKVHLLNDLEANAYGIDVLKEDEILTLNEGEISTGNRCILAAGTGLGEAGIYFDGKNYKPFAAEGGHCDFAPKNEIEIELLKYLLKKYEHVSYERLVSGPGIYEIYRFLVDEKKENVEKDFDEKIKTHSQPQIQITQMGTLKKIKVCEKALDIFISIYGSESSNCALKYFALNGVYIGGGIAPKMIDKLKEGLFLSSFINKGRFSKLMKSIPIKIILNDKAALLGAAKYAILNR